MTTEIRPENDVTKLTVPQVILLTLLLTVVSSVATAIVVVQLVATYPGETVFQTIDRITETIVERPVDGNPQTIVIKEGDLIAKAVAGVSGSSYPLYLQNTDGEVIGLGYGFAISPTELVTLPMSENLQYVSAGLNPVSHRGKDRVMLWEITGDGTFTGPVIQVVEGNPQVGQTAVYVGGDGTPIKGLITTVSQTQIGFSESLQTKDIGVLLDVGGDVIGIWNGQEVLRGSSINTQITQLRKNPIHEPQVNGENDSDFTPQTNPENLSTTEKKNACQLLGGTYNQYEECTGINSDQCQVLGGDWVTCGSPCRHDPQAEVCILSCELYCQL